VAIGATIVGVTIRRRPREPEIPTMRSLSRRFPLLAAAGLFAPAFALAQACPTTRIEFFTPPAVHTAALAGDTSASNSDGGGSVHFDVRQGTVRATVSTGPTGGFFSFIDSWDTFTLVGPAGPPLAFEARLHVTGSATSISDPGSGTGSIGIWGVLAEGNSQRDSARVDAGGGQSKELDATVRLPLLHAPGEPFDLGYGAHAGSYFAFGEVLGILAFDLPPGYLVQSCRGWAGAGSTPARGTSWGRLKSIYR
jgi:hypothetical protein